VDTGGTFTDFVARRGREYVALKVPSTPDAPERAVLEGLSRLGARPATRVRHGSTVATNTLLERKGARVTLLATAGFEDLLEIGRQERPDIYALGPRRVEPLVPAGRRIGVRERLGPCGERLLPLTPAAIRSSLLAVKRTRPETVAIGLLHAYANPAHERALARALRKSGLSVSASSELCPEIREYERLATTVTNAYLVPRVSRYIEALERACGPRLEIVLSHGGTAAPAEAAREPARPRARWRGPAASSARSRWMSAAPPPTARSWRASCPGGGRARSAATRCFCRCSMSTPWARGAARSPVWTRAACSTSGRRARAPFPARPATGGTGRPP
jgi:N-methylhydantoinase A